MIKTNKNRTNERRLDVLARLQKQLKSGTKRKALVIVKLEKRDETRIAKEITSLEFKVKIV